MRDWVDRLGPLCAGVGAVLALSCQLAFAIRGGLDFDEAYNLQIPLNLYHHGRYQTWYDGPVLFPHQITTGPTVLLPIATGFAVSGPSYRTARGVMTVFLLALLWQAYALARQLAGSAGRYAFGVGALLFVLTPNAPWVASIALGDVPGVCLLIVAIRLMSRAVSRRHAGWALAAGLALGLAALAKIVVLICAAGVFGALPLAAEMRGWRRGALRLGAAAAAGLAAPLLGWEVVKLAGLGWSGYLDNLHRFWMLMQLGGSGLGAAGLAASPGATAHAALLARALGRPVWLVFAGVGLAGAATLFALLRRPQPYAAWSLALAAAIYWMWWLWLSTWLSLRHLLTGYVLTALLLPIVIALVARDATARRATRTVLGAALAVAAFVLFPPRWPLPPLDGAELAAQEKVARAVQLAHAPDARSVFWGFGWRQAPEISFLAQIPFRDITRHAPSAEEHNFLVVTGSSIVGPPTLIQYAKPYCEQPFAQAGWSSVCRLRADAPIARDTMLHP